jgi:hypothetical protein
MFGANVRGRYTRTEPQGHAYADTHALSFTRTYVKCGVV